jgi:hypothetical protein
MNKTLRVPVSFALKYSIADFAFSNISTDDSMLVHKKFLFFLCSHQQLIGPSSAVSISDSSSSCCSLLIWRSLHNLVKILNKKTALRDRYFLAN